uniref:Reverse transcriptase domain-containing protein n=1 Tax=Chromera velia CCMP2878 TaxID=1169474 RepID=A0A0G4HAC7_9ALVE|eukprot:Cvel_25660.t1-p1 / transcript=Cvel_25660.t1 / gene=Cvel_25660 / organism=Chromera_velia_CCMP2878 / gene_product=hypothetical protein / transcript_product=hypothetical protein / location=Cvel_scaffold2939:1660-4235(-) / protein_length=496 / sequence_SO=supercontig / SO=protein_coding / is_pseudo=false
MGVPSPQDEGMGGVESDGMGVQIPLSSDPPTGEGDNPMDGQAETATAANGQAPAQDEQDQCFALNKNARGTEVRPIVVEDVFHRWVTRAILLEFGMQFERHLGPLQFAVRTRTGTEKLFRCVQTYLQRSPSSAVLNLDASNAFNTCDRQVIMDQVHAHFPQLYSFFALWYGTPSDLVFRDQSGLLRRITCEEGVQQGDVADPLLFCMGLKPSLDGLLGDLQVKHGGRGCFVGAFMDDVSMVFPLCPFQQIPTDGHDDSILHAWRVSAARLQSFGLTLRPDKSLVHSSSWQGLRECLSAYLSSPGIIPSLVSFRLCGAASGTTEYQRAHFDKKLKEARELSQAVEGYGNPQGAHLLFRFYVLPKLIYLTRIMGDVIALGEWSQADRELDESWTRIMGMTEQEWAHGEASKREYERAESATESVKLKAHHPLRQGWDAQSRRWWRAPHTQEQQRITDALHRSRRVFLFFKIGLSERVRLHSCSGNEASAWLSAIPSSG